MVWFNNNLRRFGLYTLYGLQCSSFGYSRNYRSAAHLGSINLQHPCYKRRQALPDPCFKERSRRGSMVRCTLCNDHSDVRDTRLEARIFVFAAISLLYIVTLSLTERISASRLNLGIPAAILSCSAAG